MVSIKFKCDKCGKEEEVEQQQKIRKEPLLGTFQERNMVEFVTVVARCERTNTAAVFCYDLFMSKGDRYWFCPKCNEEYDTVLQEVATSANAKINRFRQNWFDKPSKP